MRDMVVVYDAVENYGITAVNYGVAWLVEFDDVTDYYSLAYPEMVPYNTMDFEVFAWKELDPTVGWPDIVIAFDNVTGNWDWNAGPWGSVGLENSDATLGTTYAYDDWTPESGDIVCFDYSAEGVEPVVITFDVLVDVDAPYGVVLNEAMHDNTALGTEVEAAKAEFTIPMPPKLNEFVANHVGTDTEEYVEVYGSPDVDYSAYTVLEIEGDSGGGAIDRAHAVGTTDSNGLYLIDFPSMENGTITLLLVEGFTGATGEDIDTDDDGVIDYAPWTEIVDDVAVWDGGGSDLTYSDSVLSENYDVFQYTPGGASRYPDGKDTDSAFDWVRNDFDLAGITGYTGTPVFGEAYNTPGEFNRIVPFELYLPIIMR
jgi:hypothetical protein